MKNQGINPLALLFSTRAFLGEGTRESRWSSTSELHSVFILILRSHMFYPFPYFNSINGDFSHFMFINGDFSHFRFINGDFSRFRFINGDFSRFRFINVSGWNSLGCPSGFRVAFLVFPSSPAFR